MTDYKAVGDAHRGISIHIPRVGDDVPYELYIKAGTAISIHIPRVGDDLFDKDADGARKNFNPHPPCGG